MDSKVLREVINCIASLEAKEISLAKLSDCLKSVTEHTILVDASKSDTLWQITCNYYSVLTEFAEKNIEEPSDISSSQDTVNFHGAIDLVRQFTLHLYLPQELRRLTKSETQLHAIVEEQERIRRLSYCVAQFKSLFKNNRLVLHSRMIDCIIDFMAGTYSLFGVLALSEMEGIAFPKEIVFKCLLRIKGCKELPLELSKAIHGSLLKLTGEPGGFTALCRTLLIISGSESNAPVWHKSQVIAKIVASKGHTKRFYNQVLTDCFAMYQWAIYTKTENSLTYTNTCVECLKQFYQLPIAYRELHNKIETYFMRRFQKLSSPEEYITGYVVVDQSTLLAELYECRMAFTGMSINSLPSSILTSYLPLFLKLHSILPLASKESSYLEEMIIFCLSNRTKNELEQVVLSMALELSNFESQNGSFFLHPRIIIKLTQVDGYYTLQVGPQVNKNSFEGENLLPPLVNILKSTDRNLLVHDVFIILLKHLMLSTRLEFSSEPNCIMDAAEQEDVLCRRLYEKCVLIQSLEDLINIKRFQSQIYENPDDILKILEASLATHISDECIDMQNESKVDRNSKSTDLLDIVLSILGDFLKRVRNSEKIYKIVRLLKQYKSLTGCTDQMRIKIDYICNTSMVDNDTISDSTCHNALSLCADSEPYSKVYGTTLLIKLIKERDVETVARRHTILILALENLMCEESYAFLNSVRLLVSLCEVFEAETIEALVKEYHSVDKNLDYRLKIGEATIKIIEVLGPTAIRYRDELLNCFLFGMKNSVDEFRTSSLANIGNICRILSYQVHHFFYEVFASISNIMETDTFLPTRRAAILVLSQLIEGMEGLMDLQEYLISVYRFLKHVIVTDTDDVTKLQAAVALDHLKSKTTQFFTVDPIELKNNLLGKIN